MKIALLLAIELMLLISLVASSIGFVVALVLANFNLQAVYSLGWLSPVAAVGFGAVRLGLRRWIRRDFRRRQQITAR